MSKRPVIKDLPRTKVEIACEIVAAAALVFAWAAALYRWADLPDQVPMHFDFSGRPDAWAGKGGLLAVPIVLLGLYALLTLIGRAPHLYNYPVEITPENARTQYLLARALLAELKATICVALAYLAWAAAAVARGARESLDPWFLVVMLAVVTGLLAKYFAAARRSQKG